MSSPSARTRRSILRLAVAVAVLPLAGCMRRTKDEILKRAEGAKTRADLEKALGPPDERDVIAMLEHWKYHATDGVVTFHVAGDKVMFVDTVGAGQGGSRERGKDDGEKKDDD